MPLLEAAVLLQQVTSIPKVTVGFPKWYPDSHFDAIFGYFQSQRNPLAGKRHLETT
jgi:hypothetical protein